MHQARVMIAEGHKVHLSVLVVLFLSGCGIDTTSLLSNNPPIADAGKEQTVSGGDSVSLDGSTSLDPDGDLLAYSWMQISGPEVHLNDPLIAKPNFIAPSVTTAAPVTLQLTVSDRVYKSSDTVIITIKAQIAHIPGVPKVTLVPVSAPIKKGENLSFDVMVDEVDNLFSVAFDLSYDPQKLEFIDAIEGTFMKDRVSESTFFVASLENGRPGKVVTGLTLLGTQAGASGSGKLMTMTFRPLVRGGVTLSFGKPREIKGESNQTITSVKWENTSFTVE